MIFEAVFLSLIVGFIRKGRLRGLGKVDLKAVYLFMVGGMLQSLLFIIAREDGGGLGGWMYAEFYSLHLITYVCITIPLLINIKYPGLVVMGVGTFLNFLPIALNGGKMPVKLPAEIVNPVFDMGHTLLTGETKLAFLADIIYISEPYPLPKIVSIGDIFLVAGVFWFIQHAMKLGKTQSL